MFQGMIPVLSYCLLRMFYLASYKKACEQEKCFVCTCTYVCILKISVILYACLIPETPLSNIIPGFVAAIQRFPNKCRISSTSIMKSPCSSVAFLPLIQFALILSCSYCSAFSPSRKVKTSSYLPTFDPATDTYRPPPGVSSSQFYSPVSTLIRAGPVPFLTRLISPQTYEQAVFKYQFEAKEPSLTRAQGNMDAFFAAPDVWAEQKLLEQQGRRDVYDYGKEAPVDRVALSLLWGSFVTGLLGRVLWQLFHGERNLF